MWCVFLLLWHEVLFSSCCRVPCLHRFLPSLDKNSLLEVCPYLLYCDIPFERRHKLIWNKLKAVIANNLLMHVFHVLGIWASSPLKRSSAHSLVCFFHLTPCLNNAFSGWIIVDLLGTYNFLAYSKPCISVKFLTMEWYCLQPGGCWINTKSINLVFKVFQVFWNKHIFPTESNFLLSQHLWNP